MLNRLRPNHGGPVCSPFCRYVDYEPRTPVSLPQLTDGLCRLYAPMLPYMAEEAHAEYKHLLGRSKDDSLFFFGLREKEAGQWLDATAEGVWTRCIESSKALNKPFSVLLNEK